LLTLPLLAAADRSAVIAPEPPALAAD